VKWRQTAVFIAVAVVTGFYYEWGVRATGFEFQWHRTDLTGYYNYLAQGFAAGHLYLPIEPDARLLALKDPLDTSAGLDIPKLFDAVLYGRHYYLYHGAGPALLLFWPWRVVTGWDLPEGFALFAFCFAGYLFAAGTLVSMLRTAGAEVGPWALAAMLLALGFCSSIPFLLNRVWVYEIAIGSGYFCVSAGLFFLARGLRSGRALWLAASGLMLGLAVACRPHLGIVAGFGLLAAMLTLGRRAVAFAIPLLAVGVAIGMYNFARFGNPFEFGLPYQITGPGQGALHLRTANMMPGLYYMLFTRPEFTKVFPWVLIAWPARMVARPPWFFVEPIVGAMFLAPFIPMAGVALFMRRLGAMRWVVVLSALSVLGFLVTTGLSTQRYEVDFLPLLVLGAMAGFGMARHRVASCVLGATVMFGLVVNLAMGITGPYDELMKNKPARYVRIAGWFSPVGSLRPELNPAIDVDFPATVKAEPDHVRRDLFSAGRRPLGYELFVDHLNGKPVLISRFGSVDVTREMTPGVVSFRVRYAWESGEMVVAGDGVEVLRQKVEGLVSAPAEARVLVGARD
jgi:hypothetical protein